MSRYTAEDLAQLAGLTVRTVRFYVAERVIDPPKGRGRGAHFDDLHLAQLRRVRFLQGAGLDLAGIRAHLDELRETLAARGLKLEDMEKTWAHQADSTWIGVRAPASPPDSERLTRIKIARGLELHVSDEFRMPSPAELAELAAAVARAFRRRSETGDRPRP